jgi:hypothetical protein
VNAPEPTVRENLFAFVVVTLGLVGCVIALVPFAWGLAWIIVTIWRDLPPL